RRRVGLVDYSVVAKGAQAIRARIGELKGRGGSIAVVDAISDEDLRRMGPALKDFALVTAGSGVAIGLAANFGIDPRPRAAMLPPAQGAGAVLSGSCSTATNAQVRQFVASGGTAIPTDPLAIHTP